MGENVSTIVPQTTSPIRIPCHAKLRVQMVCSLRQLTTPVLKVALMTSSWIQSTISVSILVLQPIPSSLIPTTNPV